MPDNKTTAKLTERSSGGFLLITTAVNGNEYRVSWGDKESGITITTLSGSMSIKPSVSNQVEIETNH